MASQPRKPQKRALRLAFTDLMGVGVLIGWATVAFVFHEEFYDSYAVFASVLMLGAALAFYRWSPSVGREGYRLLGFFVFVQAFVTSGISVLNRVDVNPVLSTPTEEAFSAAVESTLVFGAMFMLGALVTAPRTGQGMADTPTADSGPTRLVGLILASLTVVITTGLLASRAATGVFGTLPLILVNLGILAPMLSAQPWLTGRSTRLAVGILLFGQVVAVFYSSMVGLLVLPMRDMLLGRVYLRKRLPLAFIASMIAVVLILNPIKHLFRQSVATEGNPETFDATMALWGDAATTTWSTNERGASSHQSRLESSSARLDYNWISAHVFRTVPRRLPFEEGGTYSPIATILIPRILYPDKPDSAEYGRGKWMVKLGVQTTASAKTTSFALPAPAEAYWNFGWVGVFTVPLILGLLVGLMLRWGPKDPVVRVGYVVLCATHLGQFLDMMIWIVPAFVAVGGSSVATALYARIGHFRTKKKSLPQLAQSTVTSNR